MTLVSSGNSYAFYTGDGTTTTYSTGFPLIAEAHLKVKVNDSLVSVDDYTYNAGSVIFDTAPAADADIKLYRETPKAPLVDFQSFGSITEDEMDLNQTQLIYLIQESFETDDAGSVSSGKESLTWDPTNTEWDASYAGSAAQIGNVADPGELTDAATKNYVDNVAQFGISGTPQAWYFTDVGTSFVLTNGDGLDARYLIVAIDGVLQIPFQDYTISSSGQNPNLTLVGTGLQSGQEMSVQNFGVMRTIATTTVAPGSITTTELANNSVSSEKIQQDAVTETRIENSAVTTDKLGPDAVTGAKLADASVGWEHFRTADFAPDLSPAGPPFPFLKLNNAGDLSQGTVQAQDITDLNATLSATPVSNLSAATSGVDMNGNDITNLPTTPPTNNSAASKAYVDAEVGSATAPKIDMISHRLLTPSPSSNLLIVSALDSGAFQDTTTYSHFTVEVSGFHAPSCGAMVLQAKLSGSTWHNCTGYFDTMARYLTYHSVTTTAQPVDSDFAPKGSERKILTFKLMQPQDITHRFTATHGQGHRLETRDWNAPAGVVSEIQLVLGSTFNSGNLSGSATASVNCYATLYGHRKA